MADKIRVGVRHRNGVISHYDVNNVNTWDQARAFVLEQVPTARVVLAVIVAGDRRAVTVEPTAA